MKSKSSLIVQRWFKTCRFRICPSSSICQFMSKFSRPEVEAKYLWHAEAVVSECILSFVDVRKEWCCDVLCLTFVLKLEKVEIERIVQKLAVWKFFPGKKYKYFKWNSAFVFWRISFEPEKNVFKMMFYILNESQCNFSILDILFFKTKQIISLYFGEINIIWFSIGRNLFDKQGFIFVCDVHIFVIPSSSSCHTFFTFRRTFNIGNI